MLGQLDLPAAGGQGVADDPVAVEVLLDRAAGQDGRGRLGGAAAGGQVVDEAGDPSEPGKVGALMGVGDGPEEAARLQEQAAEAGRGGAGGGQGGQAPRLAPIPTSQRRPGGVGASAWRAGRTSLTSVRDQAGEAE